MKIQPRTIKHEKFKELVKEWLDTHREEYCAFANEVSKSDRSGFQQTFQYAQFAAPTFADAVMARMSDNREDLSFSIKCTKNILMLKNKYIAQAVFTVHL